MEDFKNVLEVSTWSFEVSIQSFLNFEVFDQSLEVWGGGGGRGARMNRFDCEVSGAEIYSTFGFRCQISDVKLTYGDTVDRSQKSCLVFEPLYELN